jgi:geranylgeranylglycerol-phosphate geranylgeranyltransferase
MNFYVLIQIIRPVNFVITFFTVIVAAFISSHGTLDYTVILMAALAASLTAAAGNIINDYFDAESDKINHPERPIPSGKISKKNSLILYFAFALLSIIAAINISQLAINIVVLSNILLFLYSYSLKKKILIGNFIVAFLTGFTFIFGGLAGGNAKAAIIPGVFAFLINFIRELVKDIQDIEGDSVSGTKTFPQVYGIKSTKIIILLFSLILIAATFYPYLVYLYDIKYFIFVMAVVNPVLVYSVRMLYKDDSPTSLNKLSFILKLNMVFGLTAIYLGK